MKVLNVFKEKNKNNSKVQKRPPIKLRRQIFKKSNITFRSKNIIVEIKTL